MAVSTRKGYTHLPEQSLLPDRISVGRFEGRRALTSKNRAATLQKLRKPAVPNESWLNLEDLATVKVSFGIKAAECLI
jgi:hypothetical protein